jgi:hypothetical protein
MATLYMLSVTQAKRMLHTPPVKGYKDYTQVNEQAQYEAERLKQKADDLGALYHAGQLSGLSTREQL